MKQYKSPPSNGQTQSEQRACSDAVVDAFLRWEAASRDAIDVKRCYIDVAGDLVAGVMLSQIIYWHLPNSGGQGRLRVERDGHQWLVKTRLDWWEECRVTKYQADRALKHLAGLGIIELRRWRFNGAPTTHLRLVWPSFLERLRAVVEYTKLDFPEFRESRNSRNPEMEVRENRTSLTESTTENQQQHAPEPEVARADEPSAAAPAAAPVPIEARALLKAYGVNGKPFRESLKLPIEILRGWVLAFAAEQCERDVGVGVLVSNLRECGGAGPPEPYSTLGRLSAAVWRELILTARAIHEFSVAEGAPLAAPPPWAPPEIASAWPVWSAVYTAGPRASPELHFRLKTEIIPPVLAGDALEAPVEPWLAAQLAATAIAAPVPAREAEGEGR